MIFYSFYPADNGRVVSSEIAIAVHRLGGVGRHIHEGPMRRREPVAGDGGSEMMHQVIAVVMRVEYLIGKRCSHDASGVRKHAARGQSGTAKTHTSDSLIVLFRIKG
jgi:hypothetical protein